MVELLAIPLGCQNTPAKWLVMRRCAVLAAATAFNLRHAEVSLRRNRVVAILMYFKYIPVAALTSDLAGVFCRLSRMAMQSSVRLASVPPREFLRQLFSTSHELCTALVQKRHAVQSKRTNFSGEKAVSALYPPDFLLAISLLALWNASCVSLVA